MADKIKRPAFVIAFVLLVALEFCVLLFLISIAILATPDSTFQITGDKMLVGDVRFVLLVTLFLLLALTAYIGLGLWRGNSIARHGFLLSLIVILLGETIARERLVELPLVISALGLVAWYLYVKPGVKLFFEAATSEQETEGS